MDEKVMMSSDSHVSKGNWFRITMWHVSLENLHHNLTQLEVKAKHKYIHVHVYTQPLFKLL